jgi:GINS complex subunit 4
MDDADKQEPDWLGEMEQENDVIRLSRAWVKERGTTDIMKWEGELVEDCLEKLSQQVPSVSLLGSHRQAHAGMRKTRLAGKDA